MKLVALPERLKKPKNSAVCSGGVMCPMMARLTDWVPPITRASTPPSAQNCSLLPTKYAATSRPTQTARHDISTGFCPRRSARNPTRMAPGSAANWMSRISRASSSVLKLSSGVLVAKTDAWLSTV